MDPKALFNLQYGVFLVATKSGDKMNGCITNTCIQVASNPTRVAIAVLNTNYTCDLVKESGEFTVSVLDETTTFDTIRHFGFQSGREVDKFAQISPKINANGLPYLGFSACSVLGCKVLESYDLGSHTLFIAEVLDAEVTSDKKPITYTDYQTRIKPQPTKPVEDKKIVGWKCKICGYTYEGAELPKDFVCPLCGHDASDFEPIYG